MALWDESELRFGSFYSSIDSTGSKQTESYCLGRGFDQPMRLSGKKRGTYPLPFPYLSLMYLTMAMKLEFVETDWDGL